MVNEIRVEGRVQVTAATALLVQELGAQCDLKFSEQGGSSIGAKDGGLTLAVAVATLGLQLIQTIISVVSYLDSQETYVTLTVRRGSASLVIKGLSERAALTLAVQLANEEGPLVIEVTGG